MNMRIGKLGVMLVMASGLGSSAAQAFDTMSVKLINHPNGNASANVNAVDNRDYGLRLDTAQLQTFAFVDVTMTFQVPPMAPVNANTVYATITGTIAHLQSSNGMGVGYAGTSGLDATDQRWAINGTFRLMEGQGAMFPPGSLPASDMLQKLIMGGISNNAIGFDDFDLSISPLFNEMLQPAVYNGPRAFVEKFSDESPSALNLTFRNRLNPGVFVGPPWDVVTGHGWLMPTTNVAMTTRDLLFYTPEVPEPAAATLAGLGATVLLGRRRRSIAR